jgi:uncharacterized protein (TIGR02265 family)
MRILRAVMSDQVLFSHTVEGFQRALGPLLTDVAKEQLAAVGIDFRRPLEPAYSVKVWAEAMSLGSEWVAPGQPRGVQLFELGRRFIDGYAATLVGSAMLAVIKLMGPTRTLARMTRNFRSGNNYTETTLKELGPNDWELGFNLVFHPDFYRGLVTAGLTRAGAREAEVALVSHDAQLRAVYRVTWKA